MSKVILFGANGMLGRYVKKYLEYKDIEVIPVTRNECDCNQDKYEIKIDISLLAARKKLDLRKCIFINCAGVIKSRNNIDHITYIKTNSLFPHILQEIVENYGTKLIHITTDCVFSGSKDVIRNDKYYTGYTESDLHDCIDIYGKTKSLGEPENACVIRTSIIGEELNNSRSLLEWVKSNANGVINGYTNHFWNGVTCLELAKVIFKIIDNEFYWNGIRHVFTKHYPITKFSLVKIINDIFKLNIQIKPIEDTLLLGKLNRSLQSEYADIKIINSQIPSYIEQITELKKFNID